ncbi:MAG TPA: DUF1501 domain-containing protein [Longimicrobium sp.]
MPAPTPRTTPRARLRWSPGPPPCARSQWAPSSPSRCAAPTPPSRSATWTASDWRAGATRRSRKPMRASTAPRAAMPWRARRTRAWRPRSSCAASTRRSTSRATAPPTPRESSGARCARSLSSSRPMRVWKSPSRTWAGGDTHVAQGGADGQLARRLGELGRGIKALYDDLGDRMDDVVILTMSEFGRTVAENGTGGTDHGHANCMLLMGGSVAGGQVRGEWPGLQPEQLHEGRDLRVTTDFRDVFAEVAGKHLGATQLERVFPGHTVDPRRFRGVLR